MGLAGRGVGVSLVATAVAAALALSSCTLVGLGIGSLSDRGRPPKVKPVPAPEVQALKIGSTIELGTRDGHTLSGTYGGLTWARPEEYGLRYEAARQRLGDEGPLPALGPGARLVTGDGKMVTGEYLGLGPGLVMFREADQPQPGRVDLDRVVSLADAGGRTIPGERLRPLVSSGRVPLQAGLLLERPGGRQVVPYEEITTVSRVTRSNTGKKTGLLVGLAVDVALVTAAIISLSSDSSTTTPCDSTRDPGCFTASCPLVDSFDGRRFVLDAEPLGGATYAAAQRAETSRLDHLVETGGQYRLRLHNEQDEIDHVDAVALRVVDHAPGTEVVPDAEGRLHAVSSLVPPAEGHDLRGARVEALLAAGDGNLWLGNPYGRRSDVEADLRDGVELSYPRPAGARSATLVVRAGATALGARMLGAVLALHGRELPAFYARLNTDPAARAAFEGAREREALPVVRAWDGRAWRIAGRVRDLPSLVTRDQAVPLDLGGLPGGPLRVRIDGPPGLWALDRAVMAWSESASDSLHETRVRPERAVGEDGRELTAVLSDPDGERHTLRPGRDAVRLVFPAPPPRLGATRSVLVEAAGYYEMEVPAAGEPRRAAFRRLVEEPGAVARFILDSLREETRTATAHREF
jgi:hypothetical protein